MTQLFAYRIIETTYRNYIAYDEGPGSATSIDATRYNQVVREWPDRSESFGNGLLKNGYRYITMQEGSDDGIYEYGYTVERALAGTKVWKELGYLPRPQIHYCSRCISKLEFDDADCYECNWC